MDINWCEVWKLQIKRNLFRKCSSIWSISRRCRTPLCVLFITTSSWRHISHFKLITINVIWDRTILSFMFSFYYEPKIKVLRISEANFIRAHYQTITHRPTQSCMNVNSSRITTTTQHALYIVEWLKRMTAVLSVVSSNPAVRLNLIFFLNIRNFP